jgi:hypothetical protein
MKPAKPALEKARAELDLLEAKSEAAFKAWRTAYYRTVSGELKTHRVFNAAFEDMETTVIQAGNAYIKLREETE